jgi:type I restriction enzyme S subunit
LDDVCETRTGTRDPTKKPDVAFRYVDISSVDNKNKIISRAGNVFGHAAPSRARQIIKSNDVLVSMTRPNLNAVAMVPGELDGEICSTGFAVLRSKETILPSYLFHFVRSREFVEATTSAVSGALYPAITASFLMSLRITLPPLDEQRRIVGLLDRAAEIRRRADAARTKARAIIPALFLDTFGDPATNPKGWPVKTLGNLGELDRGRSRHRPRNAPELYGGPYPFVQTGDVANSKGRIRRHEQSYSEVGLAQSKMWPSGTLCITIAANIGKTGILEFDACFPDSVVGFKPWSEVTSEFIQASLDFMQAEIEARAPQAAQKNINLQVLRGLEMICPPLGLQIAFAEQVHRLESLAHQLDAAAAKAEAMAAGLSAEVFDAGQRKDTADGPSAPC